MHPSEGLHLYKQNEQTGHQGLISKTEPVSLSAGCKDTPQSSGDQKQLAKPDFEKAADTAEVYSRQSSDGRGLHAFSDWVLNKLVWIRGERRAIEVQPQLLTT